MAAAILQLLRQMFRKGELTCCGFHLDLETGCMDPVTVDGMKFSLPTGRP